MVGIYAIVNNVSGRRYIGSSVYVSGRWCTHRSLLRRGCHGNPHLQAAWNKYGADAFAFEVLEAVDDKEMLHVREDEWLRSFRPNLYNQAGPARAPRLGSIGLRGRRMSAEARRKMSAAKRGLKPHNFAGRAVVCEKCGTKFAASPCRKRKRFCKQECYSEFQRNRPLALRAVRAA